MPIAVLVALLFAAVAGQSPAMAFGALAIDSARGPSFGYAIDHGSEAAARAAAIAKCGSNCRTVVVFRSTCAAYAADQAPTSSVFGWGYGPTQQRATELALGFCRKEGGTRCQLRVWACESSRTAAAWARAEGTGTGTAQAAAPAPSAPPPTGIGRVDPDAARRAVEEAFARFGQPGTMPAPAPQPVAPPPANAAAPAGPATPPPPPPTVQRPPTVANVPAVAPDVLPQVSASAIRRIALVIGNDRYENLEPLQKAVNDSRVVGDSLAKIGFDVIRVENAVRRLMNQKMVEFTGKVGRGDTAFFFFSGHGVEIRGQNFLLPVDMPKVGENQEGIVTGEGIPADSIIEQLQSRGAKVTMVVLDACRENPFAKQGTRGVGATRGLAQITAPEGVFVLYSAGVGQTALDRLSNTDRDPNSVFTRKFIQALNTPGLSVQEMAKRTQFAVRELAGTVNHPQMPAYYDQILGQFTLVPAR
jgi:hypothetical protein